jgi:hypothetical protein
MTGQKKIQTMPVVIRMQLFKVERAADTVIAPVVLRIGTF